MKEKKQKSSKKKYIGLALLGVALIAVIAAGWGYKSYMWDSFTGEPFFVYIRENTTLSDLQLQLREKGNSRVAGRFEQLALWSGFRPSRYPGAYRIDVDMSVYDVYSRISAGIQTPVKFTFNNVRTKDQLAERISGQLMMGKEEIAALLNDSATCARFGFTLYTIPAMFLPDTYEIYWSVTPEKFMDRMKKEYDRYWNDARRNKAQKTGLTPVEVSVLASIVEEETNIGDERNIVAGLYLNRLKKDMCLQADPTVKFALQDFDLRRILFTHLQTDSPYNTYRYPGLPPGPIRIPSKQAIESVLGYTSHNYLYMCAKEDFSGRHNFAVSLEEHSRNAIRYHRALSARKIY